MAAIMTKKVWYTVSIDEDGNVKSVGFSYKDMYDAIRNTRKMIEVRWKLSPFLYFTVSSEEFNQLRRM